MKAILLAMLFVGCGQAVDNFEIASVENQSCQQYKADMASCQANTHINNQFLTKDEIDSHCSIEITNPGC